MKRKILTTKVLPAIMLAIASALALPIQAQVTIGSDVTAHADALLDLKEGTEDGEELSKKGLLLPRVALTATSSYAPLQAHVKGMFVYNITPASDENDLEEGIYYNDGEKWIPATTSPAWLLGGNTGTDPDNNFVGTTDSVSLMFRVNNISAGFIGYKDTTDNSNAFGLGALGQNTGSRNNAFGEKALFANIGGTNNNAFGSGALSSASGNRNIAFGNNAGNTLTNGSDNIMVGNEVQASSTTANNELNIGNVLYGTNMYGTTGKIGIGTNAPTAKLDINAGNTPGTGFKMTDGSQGNGKILTSDVNGVGTWQKQWFYLPSFNLDLSTTGTKTVNLYEVYSKQFSKAGNGKFISNNTALTTIPQTIYDVTQLDFAVTDYDDTVITVTKIDNAGWMTYNVLKTDAATDSYINIICIVK